MNPANVANFGKFTQEFLAIVFIKQRITINYNIIVIRSLHSICTINGNR